MWACCCSGQMIGNYTRYGTCRVSCDFLSVFSHFEESFLKSSLPAHVRQDSDDEDDDVNCDGTSQECAVQPLRGSDMRQSIFSS